MKTYINLEMKLEEKLPSEFKNDDVRYPKELVKLFLKEYTKEKDIVFDPFSGYGTTIIASEEMGRIGYGVEFCKDRVNYIKSKIKNKENIIEGDSLKLKSYDLPLIDFCITSPPYMSKNNHSEYPFAAYEVNGKDYNDYLEDIKDIYKQIKKKLKPNAYVIIEVSNIINQGENTMLAWDIAKSVSYVLKFQKEIIVCWHKEDNSLNEYGFGYDHSYCLVFKN